MLFPKPNTEHTTAVSNLIGRILNQFPRINPALLWLYPYYKSCGSSYRDSILLLDGTMLLFPNWSDEETKKSETVCINRENYRFFVDKQYVMTKDTDYSGEHPTQHEFECYCLQNNIDISRVKLYDELEVNNQLLMFAKSVGIPEDILESWRL